MLILFGVVESDMIEDLHCKRPKALAKSIGIEIACSYKSFNFRLAHGRFIIYLPDHYDSY